MGTSGVAAEGAAHVVLGGEGIPKCFRWCLDQDLTLVPALQLI